METNITLATKARQVESWLETVPFADVPASARALVAYLVAHDRGDVSASLRKQLFDLVLTRVWRCFAGLEAGLGGPDRFETALELLGAAARFASHLARECAADPPPVFGADPFTTVADRYLRLAREIAHLLHCNYRAAPPGFWIDVHAMGHWLFLAGRHPDAELQGLYRDLLLEAAVDPYRLSGREYWQAREIILRHGHLAQVEPVATADVSSVFGVRLLEDRPLHLLAWENELNPGSDLTLNTTELVRHLAHMLSQNGMAATRKGDLLRRLKQAWGGSAQRTAARRRPQVESRCRMTVGFMPMHRHLSDPLARDAATTEVACELVDESLHGVALRAVGRPEGFGVGSLVGISRYLADAYDAAGLVRWFKIDQAGTVRFGVKFLHGRMAAGYWNYPGQGGAQPALLAALNGAMRQVIVNVTDIDANAQLEISRGEARSLVRLTGRIEDSAEVVVFRCEE
jgi:hypothetical protein